MTTIASRMFPRLRPICDVHRGLIRDLKSAIREGKISNSPTSGIGFESKLSNRLVCLELQNEKRKNSITAKMMLDLTYIVDQLYFDHSYDSTLGLILASTGTHFSAGLDLNLLKTFFNTPSRGAAMYDLMSDCLDRIRNAPFVSVSTLNGPAIGGGMEIATATDFRIIQNNAYVHSVHAMIGASPGWGGGRRLTDIIGRKHALRMLGTSVRIDANEALEIGLCDEISENKNELISQAEQLLRPYIDQRFPRSVQGVKRVVSSYQSESNQVERSVFESRWLGEDNKQALEGIL